MYTRNSAFMANDDDRRGTLEPGKFADLAVLSADYLTAPVNEIGKIRSVLTMVGGEVVYAASAVCECRVCTPADRIPGAERPSVRAERHRAERLQQLLVELAAHLLP